MMQLPKPKGDTRKWLPRAFETDKYIQNHKDMLIYWVHKTEQEYETAASAYEILEIDDNELTRANLNVIKQYNKLYQMDHFHIIQIDGKDYNDDYYHHMTPSQIIRNSEYNAAASAPHPDSWARQQWPYGEEAKHPLQPRLHQPLLHPRHKMWAAVIMPHEQKPRQQHQQQHQQQGLTIRLHQPPVQPHVMHLHHREYSRCMCGLSLIHI